MDKTAEQEWKEKGNIYGVPDHPYSEGFEDALDLFKAALKEGIQKEMQIEDNKKLFGICTGLEKALNLIDTTKPLS